MMPIATYKAPDAQEVRQGLNLTQAEFASLLCVSLDTVQNWEQGRRAPDAATRMLLRLAERHPETLQELRDELPIF